jgi:hypothetical protein
MLIRTSRSCSKLKPNTPSFNSFSFAQEIGSNRRLLLYAFFQPVQIFLRSTCNGNHQELRHVIAMQALQLPLQLRHPSRSRFDNEQHFSRRFHLSLPSVDALDRSRHNIHAGRQSLFHQRTFFSALTLSSFLSGFLGPGDSFKIEFRRIC